MVQAARSGVQNIAEGSVASGTSKKTELKLTNVARASLEELLLDYQDFLRQRDLRIWEKDGPEAVVVRSAHRSQDSGEADPYGIRSAPADVAANTMICLINQATYLLGRQLLALERQFKEQGGFTERLYAVRKSERQLDKSDVSDRSDLSDGSDKPACPICGRQMVSRTARQGANMGKSFWGCTGYPDCKGTRNP